MTDVTRVPVPPPRVPARADWEGRVEPLRGRRVTVSNEEGAHTGFVAWTDLETDDDGHVWVIIVSERDWWVWQILGFPPVIRTRWPAGAAWVE